MTLGDIVKGVGKGLAVGTAVVASFLPINDAKAGAIAIYPDNPGVTNNALDIRHISGSIEEMDSNDTTFLEGPAPAVDFYSDVSFDPYKLNTDSRGPDSLSTIFSKIEGRGLSAPVDFQLNFGIWQPVYLWQKNFSNFWRSIYYWI